MMIDPEAAQKREMAQRANNVQAAMQLMSAMAAGGATKEFGAIELAEYALASVDSLQKYMERPFEGSARLIQQ